MSYEVVEVLPTPNPNASKFVLDRVVSEVPLSFFDAKSAQGHALACRLFAVPGVESVLLLKDFVTVNKSPSGRWAQIKKDVRKVLATEPKE